MPDLDIQLVPQLIEGKLGRQKVHDPRSKNFRAFPRGAQIDRVAWKDKAIRIYDPLPNPNQCHGECTGVAKCIEFNAVGNRKPGVVLNMYNAHEFYSGATKRDPWPGVWRPNDTGSSGLAAAQEARALGMGGEFRHVFGGADEVVQLIQDDRVVDVGTWWYYNMMTPNANGFVEPTGTRVGGHQFVARGYKKKLDAVIIRCWWGNFRDVLIKREHLNDLLMDDGDAHIQDRVL